MCIHYAQSDLGTKDFATTSIVYESTVSPLYMGSVPMDPNALKYSKTTIYTAVTLLGIVSNLEIIQST